MYIVTFYSFKGGVGRTTALVNVGCELAKRGRRVLLVDFDLEAPGITSYEPFLKARNARGIVDYIREFENTLVAPSACKYLTECEIGNNKIWIMPAGRQDTSYAGKLASIDWHSLYAERSGYLLIEDLKEQWKSAFEPPFDYVLIDSRTGHTDIGGICTRQLPDAAALLFFPNDQNIEGIRTITNEIRNEKFLDDSRITLHFCPSNVPDLDDEHDILKNKLEMARNSIGYITESATIFHYNSMLLIEQDIFVLTRPNSALSKQYKNLVKAIISQNLRDKDGAIAALEKIRDELRSPRVRMQRLDRVRHSGGQYSEISKKLEDIRRLHPEDGNIAWLLASTFSLMGDQEAEYDALSIAIEHDFRKEDALIARAANLLTLRKSDEALNDLLMAVQSENISAMGFSSGMKRLRGIHKEWRELFALSRSFPTFELRDQAGIVRELFTRRVGDLPIAAENFLKIYQSSEDPVVRGVVANDLSLTLVGCGRYEEAKTLIAESVEQILCSFDINDSFNYAMAEWGLTGSPNVELFQNVVRLEIDGRYDTDDGNYAQCLALSYAVIGDSKAAVDRITRSRSVAFRGEVFSCWRYLYVKRSELLLDLDELEESIEEKGLCPEVITRNKE